MKYYVLDENKNLVEAFDKQGVLSVLAQAIEDGSLANITADSGFINKIKCCVGGSTNYIAFITQAKYNELKANDEVQENTYYFIIDDTTAEEIDTALVDLDSAISSLNKRTAKLEGSNHTTYEITESKNILVIPSKDGYAILKVAIEGTSLEATTLTIAAPSMLSIKIYETSFNNKMNVDVYLGGTIEGEYIGKVIASLSASAEDLTDLQQALTPKVTLINEGKVLENTVVYDPFKVVEL